MRVHVSRHEMASAKHPTHMHTCALDMTRDLWMSPLICHCRSGSRCACHGGRFSLYLLSLNYFQSLCVPEDASVWMRARGFVCFRFADIATLGPSFPAARSHCGLANQATHLWPPASRRIAHPVAPTRGPGSDRHRGASGGRRPAQLACKPMVRAWNPLTPIRTRCFSEAISPAPRSNPLTPIA